MTYAPLDVILAVVTLILVIRAALRGFVEEVMGVAWLVLGSLVAIFFFNRGGAFLRTKISAIAELPVLAEVLAAVLLFLAVFVTVKLLTVILKDIIERVRLGGLDRFLGALFGFVEGVVVAGLVLFLINVQPLVDKTDILEKSFLNRVMGPRVESVRKAVIPQDLPPEEI